MTASYPMAFIWSTEDHAYHVRCRDLPEIMTAGATRAEPPSRMATAEAVRTARGARERLVEEIVKTWIALYENRLPTNANTPTRTRSGRDSRSWIEATALPPLRVERFR